MYKEVAFDPACMAEMEYYNLLKQHFGFDHGRYVATDIKAWAQEAVGHVKAAQLQPVKEKSIKNYLNKLFMDKSSGEFHLSEDRKQFTASPWINWWAHQSQHRKFATTISENSQIPCIRLDDINEKHSDWTIPRSISIIGNSDEIVKALLPTCIFSNVITLIDPYFKLADNKVLAELINQLQNTSIKKLTIVSTINPNKPKENYDLYYKGINKNNISFEWILILDKSFHDRYFITDIGAIRSGNGFEEQTQKGAHGDLLNLNIIGNEETQRTLDQLKEYQRNKTAITVFQN